MREYDRDCWDECPEYPPYPPRPARSTAIVTGPFQVSSGASVIVDVQNLGRVTTDVVVKLITWDSTAPTGVGDIFCQTILGLRPGRVGAVEFPTNVIAPGTYEVAICPEKRVNLRGSVTELQGVSGTITAIIPAASMLPDVLGLCRLTCTDNL